MYIRRDQNPTAEQLEEVREAMKRPIAYDDEAPELSIEQLRSYHQAAIEKKAKRLLTLELSEKDYVKAKSLGDDYRTQLSHMLAQVMNNAELMKELREAS